MNSLKSKIKIALADDHILLRSALADLINSFDECLVILQCSNGLELKEMLQKDNPPDIILLDLNMPLIDGFETAEWLKHNFQNTHILMLTMYDTEATMIRLLQSGVKGFLKKDVHPSELRFAINSVIQNGYYYSNSTTGKLVNLFRTSNDQAIEKNILTEQEIKFLKLAATDMTYKEIALKLLLNPRSVDNLRDHLFEKLDVKSRVGLAMYSIRHGIVNF